MVDADALELALWLRIAEQSAQLEHDRMKANATHIAAEVSRIFK